MMRTLFEHDGQAKPPIVHSKPRLERKRDVVRRVEKLMVKNMDIPTIAVSAKPPMNSPSTIEFVHSMFVDREKAHLAGNL